MQSKFDSMCKDCKTTHKIGDEVNQNSNGSWCRNGKNCVATCSDVSSGSIPPKTETKTSDIIEELKQIIKEFGDLEPAKFESIMKYCISRMMSR